MTPVEMYNSALEALETVSDCPSGIPLPQATVLLGESGSLYFAINDIVGDVCRKLSEVGETGIAAMITVWQDGSVDFSSYTFRRALCAWNPKCADSEVLLGEAPDFHSRLLRETMPPQG